MITDEWLRETEMWLALYCAAGVFMFGWVLYHLGELSRGNR